MSPAEKNKADYNDEGLLTPELCSGRDCKFSAIVILYIKVFSLFFFVALMCILQVEEHIQAYADLVCLQVCVVSFLGVLTVQSIY